MAVVIAAYQDGDLTKVSLTENKVPGATNQVYHIHHGYEATSECILRAFDDLDRIHRFKTRYKGNLIVVDGARL